MHIAFVAESQHEALVDLMHEMCVFYSEEEPVSRDDVRSNLHDNLLAAGSPVRLVVAADDAGEVVGLAAIALFHSLVDPAPPHTIVMSAGPHDTCLWPSVSTKAASMPSSDVPLIRPMTR